MKLNQLLIPRRITFYRSNNLLVDLLKIVRYALKHPWVQEPSNENSSQHHTQLNGDKFIIFHERAEINFLRATIWRCEKLITLLNVIPSQVSTSHPSPSLPIPSAISHLTFNIRKMMMLCVQINFNNKTLPYKLKSVLPHTDTWWNSSIAEYRRKWAVIIFQDFSGKLKRVFSHSRGWKGELKRKTNFTNHQIRWNKFFSFSDSVGLL